MPKPKHSVKPTTRPMAAAVPQPPPSAPPNPVPPKKFDIIKIASLVISFVALGVAVWAANETRETRLDTKRIQLRAEGLAFLQETRSVVNTFNCYALVKGADLKGKDDFMRFLADQEHLIRDGLSNISEFSPGALAIYEKSLNAIKGQVQSTFNENLVLIRNSWDKELREKADSVCKL